MALYKIFSSRVNNIEADQYTGSVVEEGLIWYDPVTGSLRLYNGDPGGLIINGAGNVTNRLVNGSSNVVVYPNGNVAISVNGTSNVAVFSNPIAHFGNLIATGNITAGYFVGNGALLTGVVSDYGNANVAAYLPTYTGTLSANSASITGNVAANYFVGNGALLTGIVTDYGNANVANFIASYTGTVSAGTVTATGNITGNYFIGNGALLTGIASDYSNANVAAYLPTYSGDLAAGNATVSATLFASQLDTLDSSAITIVPPLNVLSSAGIDDSLTVGGNIAATQITATGNVVGTYFIGNGALLTGITVANSLPSQAGQAGKYLTTDGQTATWNDALGGSLTFDGGGATANAAAELLGGTAANTQTNSIQGGGAASNYDLTLASVALTGQYEDLIDQDTAIPNTPTSAGATGQIAFDSTWVYICIAANTWRRAALQTW